ncbi:hypothetical protein NSMS1_67720 (plasmid) [Nostoc sp. MS1]|nr:hypothetical protein NSMS1_67720 [Nostoc sp. MS1]
MVVNSEGCERKFNFVKKLAKLLAYCARVLGESRGETPLGDIGFDWGELRLFREVLGIIGRFNA